MVKTIGNPLSWTSHGLAGASGHMARSVAGIGGVEHDEPHIRRLRLQDIRDALRLGLADFGAVRSDVLFICILYPAIGALLVALGFHLNLLHIVFPVAAGFALVGPVAAVGLYEVSRRRERGEDVSWPDAFSVVRSPNFGAILALGFYMVVLFLAWIVVAHTIWLLTLGPVPPASVRAFAAEVTGTRAGWAMVAAGVAAGFAFALAVLATSVVSFPLLVDHNIGVLGAVRTSWRVFARNPLVVLAWGAVVAGLLALGALPFFLGLIVVFPVLGHATWHIYRRAVRFGPDAPVP